MVRGWIVVNQLSVVIPMLIGFGLTLLFTPIVRAIAQKIGLVDQPNERRINVVPVPTGGGLAIFLAFFTAAKLMHYPGLLPYATGGIVIALVGLIDDYRGLNAGFKFIGQVMAVGIFLWLQPSVSGIIIAIWMLSVINVINFIDGLDGLATGVIVIAAFALFSLAYELGLSSISGLVLILVGTSLGFLPFNFNPAKIFLGDTGAMLLGFLFAALTAEGLLQGVSRINLSVPVMILALPVMDTCCAIIRRWQQGVPFYQADKQHFHHRLLDLGLNQWQVALCAYMLCFASAGTALFLARFNGHQPIILLIVGSVFMWGASKIGLVGPLVMRSHRRVL